MITRYLIAAVLLVSVHLVNVQPLTAKETVKKKATIKRLSGSAFYKKMRAASLEVLLDGRLNGSGWFASSDGYLFTAAHVVGWPGRKIEVRSPIYGRMKARVVAVDRGADLALLKVAKRKIPYSYLKLSKRKPVPASRIYTFGAPLFRHEVLLDGMVGSNRTSYEYYSDQKQYFEILFVSATLLKCTSGGPWVNRAGEIVGSQSGVIFVNKSPACLSHISPLVAIYRLLLTKKTRATATLGMCVGELWEQPVKTIRRFPKGTEGLAVKIINKKGPTAATAIKKWDLIVAIDGKKVRMTNQLLRIVRAKKPGDTVQLKIIKPDNHTVSLVTVRLSSLEGSWLKKRPKK